MDVPPRNATGISALDRAGYDPLSESHYGRYDGRDGESFPVYVVEFVAGVVGADPLEMKPLYESVDPEILTALVESHPRSVAELRFEFAGRGLTVGSNGDVVVHEGT